MSLSRQLLVIVCASAVLASCGLKGPLKPPQKTKKTPTTSSPTAPPPSSAPSPSPQK